jgi:hypothetical protein
LNSGDVFIVDAGLKIFVWQGVKSSMKEKQRAAVVAKAINDERGGKGKIVVFTEGDKDKEMEEFWTILGGEGPVQSAESVPSDDQFEAEKTAKLFRLSDASGQFSFKLEQSGNIFQRSTCLFAFYFVLLIFFFCCC